MARIAYHEIIIHRGCAGLLCTPLSHYILPMDVMAEVAYMVAIQGGSTLQRRNAVAYWVGETSSHWFTPSNWASGMIPTPNQCVVIPAKVPFIPILLGESTLLQLFLEEGAKMKVEMEGRLILDGQNKTGILLNISDDATLWISGELVFQSSTLLHFRNKGALFCDEFGGIVGR